MFGADATMQAWYDRPETPPERTNNRGATETNRSSMDYMFPTFTVQQPWLMPQTDGDFVGEDFILIAEFSEQEGPRPLIVIPKDGGKNFDKNEFCVKILSVDHQSSFIEGCHSVTEDAQVVMSDAEKQVHAFVHHIILNDIQARGYVRPFCISYVTSDQRKIMACYEELSQQMKKVARLMKYGNRLVFMRDLEKHQEDLSYTKARLLIMTSSMAQGDSDLLNVLNALRQNMEEVRDLLAKLKQLLNDHELEERFQHFEKQLKISVSNRQNSLQESSSVKDFNHQTSQDDGTCGSFTETLSPEFSLFNKSKDQKPKFLDVSIIKGKRRFDRSLRGLHELCSWGAKDGLQRLRHIREFFKRDVSCIELDDMDASVLVPDSGVLSFGTDCIGANFLSLSDGMKSMGRKRSSTCCGDIQGNLVSLGSVDSFKSLSSSFQSFIDEEMYSARSSMIDTQSTVEGFISVSNRIISGDSEDIDGNQNGAINSPSYELEISQNLDLDITLNASVPNSVIETVKEKLEDDSRPRSSTTYSDFDVIDKDIDVKCSSRACGCSKEKKSKEDLNLTKLGGIEEMKSRNNINVSDLANTTIVLDNHSPVCDYYIKNLEDFKTDKDTFELDDLKSDKGTYQSVDSLNVGGQKGEQLNSEISDVESYLNFMKDFRRDTGDIAMNTKNFNCDNINFESSLKIAEKSDKLPEAFLSPENCSNNETSDLMESCVEKFPKIGNEKCDMNKTVMQSVSNNRVDTLTSSASGISIDSSDRKKEMSDKETECACSDSEGAAEVFEPHLQFSINEDISDSLDECSADTSENEKRLDSEKSCSAQDQDRETGDKGFSELKGAAEVFEPHLQFSINEDISDSLDECSKDTSENEKRLDSNKSCSDQDRETGVEGFGELRIGHMSNKARNDIDTTKILSRTNQSQNGNSFNDGSRSADISKMKENNGPINGLWKADRIVTDSERHSEDELKHRHIRRKRLHPLKDLTESNHFQDHGLLKVLTGYNNLQHVIYSLLSGRPVVIIGTRKSEATLRELLQALYVFVPVVPGCDHVSLLCQIKQLKVVDIHKSLLRGIIRSEKKSLDYIVPSSIRRYITLFDVEKSLISCFPYQGSLLNFIGAIYNKKKVFKTEQALLAFIQMCLMEISSKAFRFYHCMCIPDMETNYVGVTLTRKSSMLELSADKYLNKAGLLNADSRIIKHLAEIVKIQQIDEEFKCRSLTDSPVYPFNIAYNTVQTFRC